MNKYTADDFDETSEEDKRDLEEYGKKFAADPSNFIIPPSELALLRRQIERKKRRRVLGRPVVGAEKVVTCSLSLLPAQMEWLRQQPNGMSSAARAAIAQAMDAVPTPATSDFD